MTTREKPAGRAQATARTCGCGPIPGVLFPMNDSTQVQRCDTCCLYADDIDAARALVAHLSALNVRPRDRDVVLALDPDGPVYLWPDDETLRGSMQIPGGMQMERWLAAIGYQLDQKTKRAARARARGLSDLAIFTARSDCTAAAERVRDTGKYLGRTAERTVRFGGLNKTVHVMLTTLKEKKP